MLKQWIALKAHTDWLVKLQITFAIYLRATRRADLHPWQAKKSSKLIFCGVYYLPVLVYTKTTIAVINNYSPQCRWLTVDI